jgi:hypothetical protein
MNEELLQKAMLLFDTAEKWNAFVELANKKDEIQNRWWKSLQNAVYQHELRELNPNWGITIWNNWEIKWFIKGESPNSLIIHFCGEYFRVFSNAGALDINKVNELIKDPRFDCIRNAFDRIDGTNHETLAWEYRNFSFSTIFDCKFPDHRTLSWYAGNRTEEFADQIIRKVRKLQTPEITELFREINHKCRK